MSVIEPPSPLSEVRQFALAPPEPVAVGEHPDLESVLARAAQVSRSPMLITDAELDEPGPRIVWVNDAFERMTGYRAADVLGLTPRLLQGPATDRRVLEQLRRSLEQGRDFEGEAINYRADGTPFVMAWRITAIRDRAGVVTHFLATQDDVTAMRLRPLQSRRAVLGLQEALTPKVPERSGHYALGSAYRPADGELIGGDWVDVVEVFDGARIVVVGDVAGHGSDAVAAMGQLRWATHAAAVAGLPLVEIIATLRRLADSENLCATVLLARLAEDGSVEYLSAGHTPAVIVSGGVVREFRTTGPLVGIGLDVVDTTEAERLGDGDVLVAFTDGLVERRGRDLDDGLTLLHQEIADIVAAGPTAAYLASEVVRRMVADGAGGDDVAVLAVQRVVTGE